jgi:hypothetical protein
LLAREGMGWKRKRGEMKREEREVGFRKRRKVQGSECRCKLHVKAQHKKESTNHTSNTHITYPLQTHLLQWNHNIDQ